MQRLIIKLLSRFAATLAVLCGILWWRSLDQADYPAFEPTDRLAFAAYSKNAVVRFSITTLGFRGQFFSWEVRRIDASEPPSSAFPWHFGYDRYVNSASRGYVGVTIPHWCLCAALASLASVPLLAARWRRIATDTDTCANCGYDLRATPERCPECGAVSGDGG